LGDHIGFKEHTFKEDFIVSQSFEYGGVDTFSHFLTSVDGVGAIGEDFGFDDRGQTVSLADSGVSSKSPGVFLDR
jgi:hypothetical protein